MAIAAAPVCTPTRAAMMTGMSPARLAITNHAPGFKNGMVPEGRKQAGAEKIDLSTVRSGDFGGAIEEGRRICDGLCGKVALVPPQRRRTKRGEKYEHGLRPKSQGFDLNIGGYDGEGPRRILRPTRSRL